ncbi:MAG: hypothetical protein WCT14_01700 [Treponemataceae bacterium]
MNRIVVIDDLGSTKGRPKMVNTYWGGVTEDNSAMLDQRWKK